MPTSCPEGSAAARDVIAARALPGVGDVGIARALEEFGTVEPLLAAPARHLREDALCAADRILAASRRIGARAVTLADADYPARLRELADAPAVVYAQGLWASAEPPAVAIVGTRGASSYGLRVASAIATTCVRAGVSVVSGLAQGIDGAAHEGALAAAGRTVAVLGTGLDVAYPRRHRALQARIGRDGLLLSELPPGAPAHGGSFPRRNRLIAALADVTVVVEAGVGSGALITADFAHALHREVACVPNAIDVPSSAGSNALLKEFAEPILAPDDVLSLLRLRAQPTPAPILDADAAAAWDAITRGAADVVAIARAADCSVRVATAALTALELEGLVHIDAIGRVRATVPRAAMRAMA